MNFVVGRERSDGPLASIGTYRALDGSPGAAVELDIDDPHAIAVVGKRGYGKSYTLGVLAEELARESGVAPVILDPLGVFTALDSQSDEEPIGADVVRNPAVAPGELDPASWCPLLGLSAESGPGALVWEAAHSTDAIARMCDYVTAADAPESDKRAARNHLAMADSWGVFDPEGLTAADLATDAITVLDCTGLDPAPMNAIGGVVADSLYRARIDDRIDRLPWLLVDEAHAFFTGIAADALETLLTRGRSPGVSLVVATQRPSALPPVCLSQSDVLVSHRLTTESDLDAIAAARPSYLADPLSERMPTEAGEAVIVDDETETVHAVRIRNRHTPHGGDSPRASDVD